MYEIYALAACIVLFYLAMGIGTVLKFPDRISFLRLPMFLFLLPFETLAVTSMIYAKILSETIGQIKRSEKSKVRVFFDRFLALFICLKLCLESLPVFSGIIGSAYFSRQSYRICRQDEFHQGIRVKCYHIVHAAAAGYV